MTVTVFTPTYNRGYIIKNLYDSLCRQTCKDFEWIVVDDGSNDNTSELFEMFQKQDNGFEIVYKKVPNGGKMRAVNKGVLLARGEVFFNIDSDDYASDDAIENIIKWLNLINHNKEKYVGVCGHRADFDGKIIGTSFVEEFRDFPTYEREKNGLSGDQGEVFFTDIIKKYPFPEFEGEKFISEGPTWMNICYEENKPMRYFNKTLIFCKYRDDGYTNNINSFLKSNVMGNIYNVQILLKILQPKLKERLQLIHIPYISAKMSGWSDIKFKKEMKISNMDFLCIVVGHFFLVHILRRKY